MSENEIKINVRQTARIVILDVDGPIRLGETEQALRDKVQELLGAGQRNIAVNLANVSMLDSSGIGALVRAYTNVTRAGGKFLLFSPTKMIRQTLKMVRLDTLLSVYENEGAALASL